MSDTEVERTPHVAQLNEGLYDAVITKVEALDGVQTNYGIKNMLVFTYDVDGIEIRRRYNKTWSPGGNLYKLVSTLRPGEVLGPRYECATLIGTKVRVLIGHNKSEDGSEWDNILQVSLRPDLAPEPMSMKARVKSIEELGDDPELTRNI